MTAHPPGHTPIPWDIQNAARSGHVHLITAAGRAFVQVGSIEGDDEIQAANARVIRAAPVMLAALRSLTETVSVERIEQAYGRDDTKVAVMVTVGWLRRARDAVKMTEPPASACKRCGGLLLWDANDLVVYCTSCLHRDKEATRIERARLVRRLESRTGLTPPPWSFELHREGGSDEWIIADEHCEALAAVWSSEEDARLMTLSRELLDAAKRLRAAVELGEDAGDEWGAAIENIDELIAMADTDGDGPGV